MFLWQLASQIQNQGRVKSRAATDKFMRLCVSLDEAGFLSFMGIFLSEHIVEFEDTLAVTLSNIISIKCCLSVNRGDFAHKSSRLLIWIRGQGWVLTRCQHSRAAPLCASTSTRANAANRQQLYLLLVVTVTLTLTDTVNVTFRDC